jgi:putative tryptophan/tyrosine transport system substrate-binding protein
MSARVQRRQFITLLGGAAATWPLAPGAQQGMPVLGILHPITADANAGNLAALRAGLKEGGYVEGQNLAIEYRYAEGRNDRLPALAADLVRRPVNVIAPQGSPAVLAAKAATTTIPIVFQAGIDPVKVGLVTSLNRPGGNITGVSNVSSALAAKRLELLHKFAPDAATIGVLVDPTNSAATDIQTADLQEAASGLGLRLILLNASNENEIDAAFARLMQQRVGALLLTDHPLFNSRREQLVTLARFIAIPTMYTFREFAVSGGLISYASSITDATRRAGVYVARVLKGEKPADLPIQLPTKFELVINLKTAKALGINAPPSLLALADEVIE